MILMIYTSFSTFVKVDYEILSQNYVVKKYKYINTKSIFYHLINQFKLLYWLLVNIHKSKIIYIWFADYHSFLPVLLCKLFRKNSLVVLGGYDVTYIPEYNYGSFNNPIRAFCAKYAISNATLNLAVADNIKADALKYVPTAKVEIIYTGYSDKKFIMGTDKNIDEVLSVCEATTLQRAYIKGVDLVFETAKQLPKITFNIVALNEKLARENFNVPQNIVFIDHLSQEKLIQYYQRVSVYLQFSIREGLPNSVCEAMLCGCIPVGTNSGGIPIAIGDTGHISRKRDAKELSKLIEQALNTNNFKRLKARDRIINNFSLELRTSKLILIIDQLSKTNEIN
jgi:glycosyltransferase involved in cell wall biosynthesis